MKKITFNTVENQLNDRLMNHQQMNAIKGGLRCKFCGNDMEPDEMGLSPYSCTGYAQSSSQPFPTLQISAKSKVDAEIEYTSRVSGAYSADCRLIGPGEGGYYY